MFFFLILLCSRVLKPSRLPCFSLAIAKVKQLLGTIYCSEMSKNWPNKKNCGRHTGPVLHHRQVVFTRCWYSDKTTRQDKTRQQDNKTTTIWILKHSTVSALWCRTAPRVPNSQEVKKEAARLMKIFLSNKQAIGVGECLLVHVHVKVKSLDWKTREALS